MKPDRNILNTIVRLTPAGLCCLFLAAACVAQWMIGAPLPVGIRIILLVVWILTAVGYAAEVGVLKRIGGVLVVLVAVALVVGSLLPKRVVGSYPQQASVGMVQTLDAAWGKLYGRDFFKDFNLKDRLLDYGRSFEKFDIYRQGQILGYAAWAYVLAICFLFPLSPRADGRRYAQQVGAVFFSSLLFAISVELLQVVSPTRSVVLASVLESGAGLVLGLVLFVPWHLWFARQVARRPHDSIRFNVLGVGVDAVNMEDCCRIFGRIIREGREPVMTSALGVAGIMAARRTQRLQRILNESVLNTPDGMPLVWLGHRLGYQQIRRVYGPELLRDICAYSADKGWKHFFYGAAPGVADRLKERLAAQYPGIQVVGTYCPPFRPLTDEEEADLVAQVNRVRPDIFWIGISTPQQLFFMDHIRSRLDCRIICPVGYGFDVVAGVEKEAPEWIKYSGFQWIHRALKQPRLWKRYLPDNPAFMLGVLAQFLHLRRYPMYRHEIPTASFRDAEGYPRFPAGVVTLSAQTLAQARDRVLGWIESRQRKYVNGCRADTVVQCADQPALARIVCESGMATTDGMPLVWLARMSGFKDATRVYGPDLMLEVCAAGEQRGVRHYFYGSTERVLADLQASLRQRFPNLQIAGVYSPPFRPLTEEEKRADAERINAARPDIVWCGLGTPKQDYWVADFRPRLEAPVLIAIGAAFTFHSGHLAQAPRWMMRSGLEWAYRLWKEPRRLWRRYVIGNPRFLWMVMCQYVRKAVHAGRRSR